MSETLAIILTTSFAYSVLRVTTPILFATLGACVADKAGMTNIGLDGIMLSAALAGVLGSAVTGSPWLGLLLAVLVGTLMGQLLAFGALRLKADLMLCGIALNLICSAATALLLFVVSGDRTVSTSVKSYTLPGLTVPLLSRVPVLGQIVSGHNVLTYVSILMIFVLHIFLRRTTVGLRIRSIGENPSAAASAGIPVLRYQSATLALSGFIAGFGGAFLSMGYVSFFATDMTAGRGFIAVAASAMGSGNPIPASLAALLFGFANALANAIPIGVIPQDFIQMIPYLVTIFGLTLRAAIVGARKSRQRREMSAYDHA